MDPNILPPDENLSEKQLRFGYWFVTHKIELRRYLTIALIVTCALLWVFTLGMLVKLYLIEDAAYRKLLRELPQNLVAASALKAGLPQPLAVKSVLILDAGGGRVDAIAQVTNPNRAYGAAWTGQFVAAGTTTTPQTAYILPGETKQVVDLAIESPSRLRGARYEMRDIAYEHIDGHAIPDWETYRQSRLGVFRVTDVAFTAEKSADGKQTVSRVSFNLKNDSAYSYWTVRLLVNVYRGTQLAAVNAVEIQQVETGETRKVDVVWVQDLAAISKVEVIPQIDILDDRSYMPQRAGGSQ